MTKFVMHKQTPNRFAIATISQSKHYRTPQPYTEGESYNTEEKSLLE